MSPAECQEIRRALDDGALDVLAPSSAGQKDIVEFRQRIIHWIDDFDQSAGTLAAIQYIVSSCAANCRPDHCQNQLKLTVPRHYLSVTPMVVLAVDGY